MDITFACGYCGQGISTDQAAGQVVNCPKCGNSLLVPVESEPAVEAGKPSQGPVSLPETEAEPELDVKQSTQQISLKDLGQADTDISFDCHGCGQRLVVDSAGANRVVDCPKCGTTIVVPSVRGR
jgi:DNA-directed RNA polymerase subunit RPC12/RpoP